MSLRILLQIVLIAFGIVVFVEANSYSYTGIGGLIGKTSTITVTSNTTTTTVPGTSIVRPTVVKTISTTTTVTKTVPVIQPVLVVGDDITTQITRTNSSTISTLVTATTASVKTIIVDVTYTSTIWFTEFLNITLPPNYGITKTETTTLTATVTPTQPFSNLISYVNGIVKSEKCSTLITMTAVSVAIFIMWIL